MWRIPFRGWAVASHLLSPRARKNPSPHCILVSTMRSTASVAPLSTGALVATLLVLCLSGVNASAPPTGVCVDVTQTSLDGSMQTIYHSDGTSTYNIRLADVVMHGPFLVGPDGVYPVLGDVHLVVYAPPGFEEDHATVVQEIALRQVDEDGENWMAGVRFVGATGPHLVAVEHNMVHFLRHEHWNSTTPYHLEKTLELYADGVHFPVGLAVIDGLAVVAFDSMPSLPFFWSSTEGWLPLATELPPARAVAPRVTSNIFDEPSIFLLAEADTTEADTTSLIQLDCLADSGACSIVMAKLAATVSSSAEKLAVDSANGYIALTLPRQDMVLVYAGHATGYGHVHPIVGKSTFGTSIAFAGSGSTLLISTPVDLREESVNQAYALAGQAVPTCTGKEKYWCGIPPVGTVEEFVPTDTLGHFELASSRSMINPTFEWPFGYTLVATPSPHSTAPVFFTTITAEQCFSNEPGALPALGALYPVSSAGSN